MLHYIEILLTIIKHIDMKEGFKLILEQLQKVLHTIKTKLPLIFLFKGCNLCKGRRFDLFLRRG